MGDIVRLHDIGLAHDMIRQESVLAVLRRPRAVRLENRDVRIVQYRKKVEELRAISEDVILAQTRATLLTIADSYEAMARMLENLPRSGPTAADLAAQAAV
jgi:hypothetical protein